MNDTRQQISFLCLWPVTLLSPAGRLVSEFIVGLAERLPVILPTSSPGLKAGDFLWTGSAR